MSWAPTPVLGSLTISEGSTGPCTSCGRCHRFRVARAVVVAGRLGVGLEIVSGRRSGIFGDRRGFASAAVSIAAVLARLLLLHGVTLFIIGARRRCSNSELPGLREMRTLSAPAALLLLSTPLFSM